jgi:hypothetical protein
MIVLRAIRLDIHDRFQYRIDAPGGTITLHNDAAEAADKLSQLRVARPERLVTHVETWGIVEIWPSED